jgi:4-amino-4-deoxy-L-arabinose transferase-like glycosyltransferase
MKGLFEQYGIWAMVLSLKKFDVKRLTVAQQEWLISGALFVLTLVLRLPFLDQPLDNNGAANAYHARLILGGEPLYGSHHPAHHMPAIYYLYALSFVLFGDDAASPKLLLIPWTAVSAYLLYLLGRVVMSRSAGFLAALFYILLTSHIWLYGTTAQRELFALLPQIGAVLSLLYLIKHKSEAWKFIYVGLLSGAYFYFKATYISPLLLGVSVLLHLAWSERHPSQSLRQTIRRGVWIGIGFALALLPIGLYFGWLGLLPRFLMVFTLGQDYIGLINVIPGLETQTWLLYVLFPVLGLGYNNLALLSLSLAAFLLIILKNDWRRSSLLYIAVWYALVFVEAGLNRRYFAHYYLLIVPGLSLLAAYFLMTIYHQGQSQPQLFARRVSLLLVLTLLLTTFALSIQQNYNYYRQYLLYKTGAATLDVFLREGWPEMGPKLVQLQELADYIMQNTTPTDHIYYWSFDVQLYYLADRRATVDIIWPEYAELTGAPERIFAPTTKYVVIDTNINGGVPQWIRQGLAESYYREKVLQDQEIYRRLEQAAP